MWSVLVFSSYRHVLSRPGALAFSSAGLLARLPISMVGVGIVLLVSSMAGSYAVAGAVSATFALVQAFMGPQLARLVDRFGQRRVMLPAVLGHSLGLVGLVAAVAWSAPTWLLFLSAGVAGSLMGSMGSMVRARWTSILKDDERSLHSAFSLESVFDEVVFVTGPLLVSVLAVNVAPVAGVLAAAVAGLTGGLLFLSRRDTEPVVTPHTTGSASVWSKALVPLLGAFVMIGAFFGSFDVAAIAVTEDAGRPGMVGVLLACLAAGSLVGGLVYGTLHWKVQPRTQIMLAASLLAVGTVPLALSHSLLAACAIAIVTGVFVSPMMIAGNTLVRIVTPTTRLTEALAWTGSALGVGVAAGNAAAGWVVDHHAAHSGYLVATMAGVLAAVVCLVFRSWMHVKAPSIPVQRNEQSIEAPSVV